MTWLRERQRERSRRYSLKIAKLGRPQKQLARHKSLWKKLNGSEAPSIEASFIINPWIVATFIVEKE